MDESSLPLRKIAIGFIVFVLVVWGSIWLVRYLTTGKLTVTTSESSNIVSVRPLDAPVGGSETHSASQSLTIHLKPGQYVISASSHSYNTSRVVSVKARGTSSYRLNPPNPGSTGPVFPAEASDLAADSSSLIFVDSSSRRLMRISRLGAPSQLSDMPVRQSSLASPDFGVAQDESGRLYKVTGGGVSALDTHGVVADKKQGNLAVSARGLLAFTSGGKVYAGQLGTKYRAVYSLTDNSAKLYAGGDKIAVIEKIDTEGQAEGENKITLIDTAGHKKTHEIEAVQVFLSPSGKYIFVAGEVQNHIYDSSFNLVATLDSTPFGAVSWVNDEELAYSTGRYLWLYDLGHKTSSQIANAATDIGRLATSADQKYLYLATLGNNYSGGTIARLGLDGQAPAGNVKTLATFLPESSGVCNLSYVVFGAPSILISYPPATTPPKFCVNAAKGQLAYYNVDSSGFRYITIPSSRSSLGF